MREKVQYLSFSAWLILLNTMTSVCLKPESHRGELSSKVVHSKKLRVNVKLLLKYYLKMHFSKLIFFSEHSEGLASWENQGWDAWVDFYPLEIPDRDMGLVSKTHQLGKLWKAVSPFANMGVPWWWTFYFPDNVLLPMDVEFFKSTLRELCWDNLLVKFRDGINNPLGTGASWYRHLIHSSSPHKWLPGEQSPYRKITKVLL